MRGIIHITRKEKGRAKLESRDSPPITDPECLKASRMTCLCGTGKIEVIAIRVTGRSIDSLGAPKRRFDVS